MIDEPAAIALAESLRQRYGAISAAALARVCRVEVKSESWQVAGDRIIYLAECSLSPPRIVLNSRSIQIMAERFKIDREQLTELVLAHELFHIISQQPSIVAGVEPAAHAFAATFTGIDYALLFGN